MEQSFWQGGVAIEVTAVLSAAKLSSSFLSLRLHSSSASNEPHATLGFSMNERTHE